MCGIVAYNGSREAYPIVLNGLKRLEYRGYDSTGICIVNGEPFIKKRRGKVADLESSINNVPIKGTIGMGHTRWATHGTPSDGNAHPHMSMNGHFIIIHNGIIENYGLLKSRLERRGYTFKSDTDTEILVNLIEYIYLKGNISAEIALRLALTKVVGAYGIVVICRDEPNMLIAARKGSPLVIGVGDNEYFVASDATPIIEHTNSVIFLNDNDIAIIRKNELTLKTIANEALIPNIQKIDLDIEEIEKNGFEHFMLKEIFEQPRSIEDTFRGRISADHKQIHLGGLYLVLPRLVKAKRLILIGCGTSWHAALVGEYLIEEFARIPVEVEYASEFRYRNPIIYKDDIVIAISQSGETADTLAAIKFARSAGALVLGICNVVGSSIPRETDAGVYTHAGPEIGVASTKAFTAQVTVLTLIALLLGRKRDIISQDHYEQLIAEMLAVPKKIEKILESSPKVEKVAEVFKDSTNFLYLGRGYFFPLALEGALKLKEISYIHAEGYPAAEMKHGPIALIDQKMPVVVIAPQDNSYEKVVSNVQEIKARDGVVISIVTEGDKLIRDISDYAIEIPKSSEIVESLLAIIPLQLLAYYIAVMRGCNVDQPRNLAKSVTVE
ncbi:MAG: glutamine--fructose-6-phosphate transaminase (isomerizing) [Tenuifilaceae bacterium]|jgi:glucosamine--fructose-6-phosphate aminotransferase (isomerizing)|nr:glutamine--fructose-6-phosphate transaminase (isomerizing) [Bacteroidales bacterium]MDI9515618.1 glutamine--fructose-6-phosphate transaminase (isomerizing) [Bacteroidota bacterium]NLH55996.1 glutamine--fructose-6-phosphate transaminase (isomerizing) [Rikenellaceae bacterium]OQC62316.1 MAG: Glutamine--fructose-6-phosphate aminotransferase (isomerizing) [Bacteroidetes bacterium ADurb.Bin008]HNV81331.1 glutamine--fructose-6-phosphate transaminase (isomerizing) [Tenuifilaceae bacterium]